MVRTSHTVERRDVLELAGGALAAAGATGFAAAAPDDAVRVNVGYSAASGRQAALDAADAVVREFAFDALTVRTTAAAAESLAERADVRYVEYDGRMATLSQYLPWGIDRIDADVVHANGETGDGADVAIIDTGIDDDHEDLEANVGKGKAFVSCSGLNCNYAWSDDHNHGTHSAGIVGAVDNNVGVVGVAPEVTLHAVKVFDDQGSGSYSDVAAGIEYVADQGWDVANMGFGSSSGSQTVKDACQYAWEKGVLLVAAAGNDGPCIDCVSYPAAYAEVIAVSGFDCTGLASFSSQGDEVELIAPATNVCSTIIDCYDDRSGTSMAAAHVSGTGAQLMANGYSNREARDRMCETAEDVGLSSAEQGCGLVDAAAALGYDSSDDADRCGDSCSCDDGGLLL